MSDDILVDVIILSLNRVEDTKQAIASALEQEGVGKWVWVLDQGSEPAELAELEAFCAGKAGLTLDKVEKNLGVAGGRNYLSRKGSAPFIVALDNDAEFLDSRMLERTVEAMRAEPELAAMGFKILNFTTKENDAISWGYPKSEENDWRSPFYTTRFIGAGHCIDRAAFEKVGGYDDRLFFYWEEFDLSCRLINLGRKIKYNPEIAIYHKVSPEKRVEWSNGRYFFYARNRLYIRLKYGASWPQFGVYAAAYFVKGLVNGVPGQALKGAKECLEMFKTFKADDAYQDFYKLSPAAEDYIETYDTRLRGSLMTRLRTEVLGKLPGSEDSKASA